MSCPARASQMIDTQGISGRCGDARAGHGIRLRDDIESFEPFFLTEWN
jgi:hypothetical protein